MKMQTLMRSIEANVFGSANRMLLISIVEGCMVLVADAKQTLAGKVNRKNETYLIG